MKRILATLVITGLFATPAEAAGPPMDRIVLRAKNGDVTFEHAKHTQLKCGQCHTIDHGGTIPALHEGDTKKAAHAMCQECHKKEAKGPTKCGDCHRKE